MISDEELERGGGGEGGGGVSNSRRQITNEEAKSTKMFVDDQIATCTCAEERHLLASVHVPPHNGRFICIYTLEVESESCSRVCVM